MIPLSEVSAGPRLSRLRMDNRWKAIESSGPPLGGYLSVQASGRYLSENFFRPGSGPLGQLSSQ